MTFFLRLFLFVIPVLLISCGKKDSDENLSKSRNITPSSTYSPVKNSSSDIQKNQSIDFTWAENGKDMKLSDFKGKVVVLNFWATWCGPCKREIPALSQISNELKDKDFKLIGVSIDQNPAALENYLRASPIPYTILHERGELLEKYMHASGNMQDVIPQTFIIDKSGRIAETLIGGRTKGDFLAAISKYF